jgi:hypothetical protein
MHESKGLEKELAVLDKNYRIFVVYTVLMTLAFVGCTTWMLFGGLSERKGTMLAVLDAVLGTQLFLLAMLKGFFRATRRALDELRTTV